MIEKLSSFDDVSLRQSIRIDRVRVDAPCNYQREMHHTSVPSFKMQNIMVFAQEGILKASLQ